MIGKNDLLELKGVGNHASEEILYNVERALFREARLLDDENIEEWLSMLSEDLVYWMPIRENHLRKYRLPEIDQNRMALFDETKESLRIRLKRNDSGMCWTEDPPTRHAYAVSNIEAFETSSPDTIEVHSVVTLYRSRFERDDSTLMARRKDLWKVEDGEYALVGRLVLLQQSTLRAKNLNVFF